MKKMTVMMLKTLEEIGEMGEVVSVSRGYARNYLIPHEYALPNSRYARNLMQGRHRAIAHTRAQLQAQAEEYKTLIEQEPCQIKMRAAESGTLFGAVTPHTLVEELAKRSIHVSTKKIRMPQHRIGVVGEHAIPIHLSRDVVATLALTIEASE